MRLLCIDPGITTGWVILDEGQVSAWGETQLWSGLDYLIEAGDVDRIVMEEYRLYPGRSRAQWWSTMDTVKVIGVVEYLAGQMGISLTQQPASMRKMVHLGKEHVEVTGSHAKDALRHGISYLRRILAR